MDLSKYISELLFQYDRAVVPGLGIFSTKYIPARIHPSKNTFEPPRKEILFTSAIKDDNGALIKQIATKENLDEKTAKGKLEEFVKECNTSLSKGEEVILENIGILLKRSDGTFVFKADKSINYLEDSFGLEEFEMPDNVISEENKIKDSGKKSQRPEQIKKAKKKYAWFYILIPVAAVVIIGIFNYDLIISKWNSYFHTSEIVNDSSPSKTKAFPEVTEMLVTDTLPEKDTVVNAPNEHDTAGVMEAKAPEENEGRKIEKQEEVTKRYYIVAGSFSSEKNAEKLLKKLKSKGYNAAIFGQTPKGLLMVSYESFATKQEALKQLNVIVRNENPHAWLIHY